jgi:hypothetical protein
MKNTDSEKAEASGNAQLSLTWLLPTLQRCHPQASTVTSKNKYFVQSFEERDWGFFTSYGHEPEVCIYKEGSYFAMGLRAKD